MANSVKLPLLSMKFYFIDSIKNHTANIRYKIQELGGTTITELLTQTHPQNHDFKNYVIIADKLKDLPEANLPKKSIFEKKLFNFRSLRFSKKSSGRASSQPESSSNPEINVKNLYKKNSLEIKKAIEFSTQHQIRVLKVAGVTEWLKKTEEKYKQQVKDKQNNLCSESSIPKIKNLDSHAKIVDNFLQFRPRLFSTAHEIQFEAGKNPLNHEQMNRSSHEILEKVYNKNKAYKKSILAKHLGGELIASGSEDVNQSNGELLRQKIDEFILSKNTSKAEFYENLSKEIKSIEKSNKNPPKTTDPKAKNPPKKSTKFCEVCCQPFLNIHYHWNDAKHQEKWLKLKNEPATLAKFRKIQNNFAESEFYFDRADEWKFDLLPDSKDSEFQFLSSESQALLQADYDRALRKFQKPKSLNSSMLTPVPPARPEQPIYQPVELDLVTTPVKDLESTPKPENPAPNLRDEEKSSCSDFANASDSNSGIGEKENSEIHVLKSTQSKLTHGTGSKMDTNSELESNQDPDVIDTSQMQINCMANFGNMLSNENSQTMSGRTTPMRRASQEAASKNLIIKKWLNESFDSGENVEAALSTKRLNKKSPRKGNAGILTPRVLTPASHQPSRTRKSKRGASKSKKSSQNSEMSYGTPPTLKPFDTPESTRRQSSSFIEDNKENFQPASSNIKTPELNSVVTPFASSKGSVELSTGKRKLLNSASRFNFKAKRNLADSIENLANRVNTLETLNESQESTISVTPNASSYNLVPKEGSDGTEYEVDFGTAPRCNQVITRKKKRKLRKTTEIKTRSRRSCRDSSDAKSLFMMINNDSNASLVQKEEQHNSELGTSILSQTSNLSQISSNTRGSRRLIVNDKVRTPSGEAPAAKKLTPRVLRTSFKRSRSQSLVSSTKENSKSRSDSENSDSDEAPAVINLGDYVKSPSKTALTPKPEVLRLKLKNKNSKNSSLGEQASLSPNLNPWMLDCFDKEKFNMTASGYIRPKRSTSRSTSHSNSAATSGRTTPNSGMIRQPNNKRLKL